VSESPRPSATEGTALVYRTREGPVMVEREVVALQSGRAGRPVFVRTKEGKVLSATLAGTEEPE
jgi:flagella basal body P-ring formation protein FlgA